MNNRTKNNMALGFALLAASTISLSAQSTTPWSGYFTDVIAAGTSGSPVQTVLSFPLLGSPTTTPNGTIHGEMVGQVTSVTSTVLTTTPATTYSNTVTNTAGGWDNLGSASTLAGTLSDPQYPNLIQFTSGNAIGRTFLISTTTGPTGGTTLTIDATDGLYTDLQALVNPGDTYAIITADTISTVFGTGNSTGQTLDVNNNTVGCVLGGTSGTTSDEVQVFSPTTSAFTTYFYNTNPSTPPTIQNPTPPAVGWVKTGLIPVPASNIVIRPDSGAIYLRRAPVWNLTMTGRVPGVNRAAGVISSGITFLSNNLPESFTLATMGIQNISVGGTKVWNNGTSSTQGTADDVQVYNTTLSQWVTYYFNGTDWIKTGLIPQNGDAFSIPAGSVFVVLRKSATGVSVFDQTLPYSP